MSEMKDEHVAPAVVILMVLLVMALGLSYLFSDHEEKPEVHNRVTVECVFGLSRVISEDYKDAVVNTNDVRHMIKVDGNYYLFPIQNCLIEVIH